MKRLLDARHRWRCLTSLLVALLTASHVPAQLVDPAPNAWTPSSVQHVTVYGTAGRFAGWPANHGAWSWGNEILVGFSLGYHKDLGEERHNIDRDKPEAHLFARSLDGGVTWKIEHPSERGGPIAAGKALHGIEDPQLREKEWRDLPVGIRFDHPDFAMTVRMLDNHAGPSRFYYSYDRGRNWEGPFRLPNVGTPGIAARTDYLVHSKNECTLFVTAAKSNGREGRPCCLRTVDGGKTWSFLSWIGEEPEGYSIMPSTIAIDDHQWLTAIRCRNGKKSWIENYRTLDRGASWKQANVPVEDLGEGNPASMIRLADGRICITYGYRAAPFGMRARFSQDGGKSWGKEVHLRDDGEVATLDIPGPYKGLMENWSPSTISMNRLLPSARLLLRSGNLR